MAEVNSLTLEEVKEIMDNRNIKKEMYHNEIVKQVEEFDNEIYHIRKGKISYQPQLIENLLEVAHELGNDNLTSHLTNLVKKEETIEIQIDLESNPSIAGIFPCTVTLTSKLPSLSNMDNECFTITFGDNNGYIVHSIESLLKKELNSKQDIPLTNAVNTHNLKEETEKLNATIDITLPSLSIFGDTSEIKLDIVTKFVNKLNKTSVYQNCFTYNDNLQQNIDDVYSKMLAEYTESVYGKTIQNKEKYDNEMLKLNTFLEGNKNFLHLVSHFDLMDKVSSDENPLFGIIEIVIGNRQQLTIYLDVLGSIKYYVQEKTENGFNLPMRFKEKYSYKYTTMEKFIDEINTIYEKAKIVLDI